MMKKIVSMLIAITMLGTSTAGAVGMTDGEIGGPVVDYITSLTVSSDTVNPAQNLNTTVSASMVNTASLYVFVINPNYEVVATLKTNGVVTPGTYNYVWNGRVGNVAGGTALANGLYTIRAFAYDTLGNVVDYDYKRVTLNNEAVVPPVYVDITNLVVSPSTITTTNQNSAFSFDLNKTATLRVEVLSGSTVVKTFTNYTGTNSYNAGAYTLVWDGRNNAGNLVANGNYTVRVVGADALSTDTETRTVGVVRDSTVNVDISNLNVSPSTIIAGSQNAAVSFNLNKDASVLAEIRNGNTTIRSFSGFNGNSTLSAGNKSLSWDGRNNLGILVPNGGYTVYVYANDGTTTDTQVATVSVTRDSVVNVDITNLVVSPSTITNSNLNSTISFDLNKTATLRVEVLSGSSVVRTFTNYTGTANYNAGSYSIVWDGKNNAGNFVVDGNYTARVVANDSVSTDTETKTIVVDKEVVSGSIIKNLRLYPSTDWDPNEDDELEIEFELTDDVDNLTIVAKKGSKTVEIMDEDDAREDDYSESWDGTDEDGDDIETGTWEIRVTADGETVSRYIDVVREVPEITDAFVTKTSFDNEIGEVTNLVFKTDTDAEITVELYKGTRRLERLLEEEEVSKNRWYSVEWDGTDDDGDEVSEGDYELRITARNIDDRKLLTTKTVTVKIDEDTASRDAANVTNDYTKPVVFDSKNDDSMTFSFCMDEDAEAYLAIYKGLSSSGSSQAVLLDYVELTEGCHEVKWNGEDDDGKVLKDNVYSYRLISKTSDGKRDTENGRFVVGKMEGTSTDPVDPVDPVDPTPVSCGNHYYDVTNVSPELCQAITWATKEGIFQGYSDGSFKPYQNINRAETLKVIFEAFRNKVTLLPANGTTLGFKDVDANAWYMTYARTAKFYGMLHGYVNETEARFGNNINRVEFLKFALEASDAFTSYEVPGHTTTRFTDVEEAFPSNVWYYDYAGVADTYNLYNTYFDAESGKKFLRPGQLVQRGEVALLLYRMYLNGLTQ